MALLPNESKDCDLSDNEIPGTHEERVKELLQFCDRIGKAAKARGMTEEILDAILKDRD